MSTPVEVIKSRPAEAAMPITTVLAALIAKIIGVEDTDTIFYIAIVISFVPAAVTWCVELMKRDKSNGTTFQRPSNKSS
jgi:hypothetical protein